MIAAAGVGLYAGANLYFFVEPTSWGRDFDAQLTFETRGEAIAAALGELEQPGEATIASESPERTVLVERVLGIIPWSSSEVTLDGDRWVLGEVHADPGLTIVLSATTVGMSLLAYRLTRALTRRRP